MADENESSEDETWTPSTNESVTESSSSDTVSTESVTSTDYHCDTEEASKKKESSKNNHKTNPVSDAPRSPEIRHRPREGGDRADFINSPDLPDLRHSTNTEEMDRSLNGAFERLLDPWILSFFIVIIAGFLVLPFKALIVGSYRVYFQLIISILL